MFSVIVCFVCLLNVLPFLFSCPDDFLIVLISMLTYAETEYIFGQSKRANNSAQLSNEIGKILIVPYDARKVYRARTELID